MRLTLLLQSSLDISSRARSSARALSLVSDFWAETRPRHPAAADTQSSGKRSGVSVGETTRLGPPFQTDEPVAREIVAHARDHGVNFIDTADVYSTGKSESMVGGLIKSQRGTWRRTAFGHSFVIGASQTLRPARPNLIASSSNHSSIFVDSIFRQWLGRRACMLSFRSMMPARGITFGRLRWKEA